MGLRRPTEEELKEAATRRPALVAYIRQRRAEAAEQKAKLEAATFDAMEGLVCGGIDEGYGNQEARFPAPTQHPSQQAASRSNDTEPST